MEKIKTLAINLLELEDKKRNLLLEISANQEALSKAYCEEASKGEPEDLCMGEKFLFEYDSKFYWLQFSEYEFSNLVETGAEFI
ncbi:MAG: hypothetical protein DCE90_17930 [Pseudanabaena sp.]|nr:MAG: hypothetical protein DCE90_17930 [Pseudanabaena sp.]